MRIAVISAHTCPLAALGGKETGGMNVYVRETSARLARRGIYVDVFTRSQNPQVPRRVELAPGATVYHIPAGPEKPYHKDLMVLYMEEFVQGIMEVSHHRYDLIHSHYWLSGIAGLSLKDKWDVPLVHMYHTLAFLKNMVARSPAEMEPLDRVEAESLLARRVDLIVAPHPLEKAQLVWNFRVEQERIRVIPCGVDLSLFHPLGPAPIAMDFPFRDIPFGLFVGRLDPIKGLDTLFEAALILRHESWFRDNPVKILLIGGPPWSSPEAPPREVLELMEEITKRGIEDVVIPIGPRSQMELPAYYGASRFCVLPSRYESFGMVALEAMACGTPVIASRVGGLNYLVLNGQTGILVPEGDPQGLAKAMAWLFRDDVARAQLGKNAALHARLFSWDGVVEKLVDAYKGLVDSKDLLRRQRKSLPDTLAAKT